MRLIGVLLLVFGLSGSVLLVLLGLARRQSLPPTYLESGDCPLPCWMSLQPGNNFTDDYWTALEAARERGAVGITGKVGYVRSDDKPYQWTLAFTPENRLTIGDVLLVYGAPDHAEARYGAHLQAGRRQIVTEVRLYWVNGYVEVQAIAPGRWESISPRMRVISVIFRTPAADPITPIGSPRWHGFGSLTDYQKGH